MGVRPWIGDFAAVRGDLLLILQMRSCARAHRNVRVAVFRDRSREIFSRLVITAETALGKNQVPWSHYAEIASGLSDGRNVLTGEATEVDDTTTVGPRQALIVEFKRK